MAGTVAPPEWFELAEGGPRLAVRHRPAEGPKRGPPVVFVHGATLASELYDVPAGGYSWMKHAALNGRDAFAFDVRGYGRSERPPSFEQPANENEPYARHDAAVADIVRTTAFVRERTGADRIDLVGGSWGSITAAMFAAAHAAVLRKLALFAPIFAEVNEGWLAITADPQEPTRPNPNLGAYRRVTREAVRTRWDAEIPVVDKTTFRPEPVFTMLMDTAIGNDRRAFEHDPPAMRVPNGTLLDLHEAFSGRPLYDPSNIATPTLLIRGACDPTSTAIDMAHLADGLPSACTVTVSDASHFAIAERAAPRIFGAAETFFSDLS